MFKCTVLKTLNSDFLEWEDTLGQSQTDNRSGIRLVFMSLILQEVFPTLVYIGIHSYFRIKNTIRKIVYINNE